MPSAIITPEHGPHSRAGDKLSRRGYPDSFDVVDTLEKSQLLQLVLGRRYPRLRARRAAQVLDEQVVVISGHQGSRAQNEDKSRRCGLAQQRYQASREVHVSIGPRRSGGEGIDHGIEHPQILGLELKGVLLKHSGISAKQFPSFSALSTIAITS